MRIFWAEILKGLKCPYDRIKPAFQGLITNPDNTKKYVGEFWENERNGWGVYICTSPRGNEITSYKGYYKNDVQDGLGEAHYADGSIYKGFWKSGNRNGHGVMFYQQQPGTIYMGNWQDDKRQGYVFPHFKKVFRSPL